MPSYNSDEKDGYRNAVWHRAERRARKPMSSIVSAYMDTSEALESKFLIGRGHSPWNLFAINRERAQVAALTQTLDREDYPRVHTCGQHFPKAVWEGITDLRLKFDVLHFDGTSYPSGQVLFDVAAAVLMAKPRILIVNLLSGREGFWPHAKNLHGESTRRTSSGEAVRETHQMRIEAFMACLVFAADWRRKPSMPKIERLYWDTYLASSRQTFVWGVMVCDYESQALVSRFEARTYGGWVAGSDSTVFHENLRLRLLAELEKEDSRVRDGGCPNINRTARKRKKRRS